jgi:ECF transporter, substrate-specific component
VQSVVRTLLLVAATVLLGLSPIGFVTVPGLGGAITFLHLPMILAATLESPLAAGLVGATFGLVAGWVFPVPPLLYHVGARTLAGLTAGITFQAISSAASEGSKLTIASAVTAIVATCSNTLFMCIAMLMLNLAEPGTLFSVALVHGAIELAAALIVTTPLTIALKGKSP